MQAWFPKDKGGDIQTVGPMGKIQMSKGEPIKLSTTLLVLLTQSFITARNWLSWLLHGMGKVWQPKFELEKPSVFGEMCFDSLGKQKPKNVGHSTMLSRWHVFLPIFFPSREFSHALRTSCVCNHSRFWLLPHFAQAEKSFLVIISGWVFFPTFCCIFLHCFQARNLFSGNAQWVGEETHNFGCYWALFWPW